MENLGNKNPENLKIESLLGQYLKLRTDRIETKPVAGHLDQDTLAAFTEGRIGSAEAKPVVSHLVDCSFCRHVTTELVRLDLAFAEDVPAPIEHREPTKVSEVLSGILSRIFGTGEAAVFAHEEPEKEEDKSEKEENKD